MKYQASCDVECYHNYFLVKGKVYATGHYINFEMYAGKPLDVMGLRMFLGSYEIHGFNWINYDLPMITLALKGVDNAALKAASDNIIVGNMRSWQFYQYYGLSELNLDQIDLMEVAPGVAISLKMYAGRMHSKRMQDLPYDPATHLSRAEQLLLSDYCGNDLDVTHDMAVGLKERLDIRREMSKRFGIDLRSKSDAQIAEAVIQKVLGYRPRRVKIPHGHSFYFKCPDWVEFQTPYMQDILRRVCTTKFKVSDLEQVRYRQSGEKDGLQLPAELEGLDIRIGEAVYRMGMGGLHSQEANRALIPSQDQVMADTDVKSYYPSLILNAGYYPPSIGPEFIRIYRDFYEERMTSRDEVVRATIKIILNGLFGKLGSKYSIVFAPELLIQTTISGQLAILMLIEALELNGIPVVSGNTDGVVTLCDKHKVYLRDSIVRVWEDVTGLATENKRYAAIFNKSVNDYVAFDMDGKPKRKGTTFAVPGLNQNKHPDREICADAAVAYLQHGTPLAETIYACKDIRKFLRIRRATGGAVWNHTGEYLGKAVRWYWGHDKTSKLLCAKSITKSHGRVEGKLVASSQGAVPCMELPEQFPNDLNHDYYIDVARDILNDVGVWAGKA